MTTVTKVSAVMVAALVVLSALAMPVFAGGSLGEFSDADGSLDGDTDNVDTDEDDSDLDGTTDIVKDTA